MNERFRELSEQVLAENYAIPDYSMKLYTEKFAELLVREGANQIRKQCCDVDLDDWDRGYEAGLFSAIDALHKHFGVEE